VQHVISTTKGIVGSIKVKAIMDVNYVVKVIKGEIIIFIV